MQEGLVRVDIQLLLLFALDVGLADKHRLMPSMRGQTDLRLDHLGRERDTGEEIAEGAAGLTNALLLGLDVLLERS